MRTRFYVLMGLIGCFLIPSAGFTQFPGGGNGSGGPGGKMGGFSKFDPSAFIDQAFQGKTVLSRDDIKDPMMQRIFDRMMERMGVTNGQLTREQADQYMQQRASGGGPGGGGPPSRGGPVGPGGTPAGGNAADNYDRWAEGMFRRYDTNGDGVLNYDEMPEHLRAEREKWDANHDGFIDLDEFKLYFRAMMQQRQADAAAYASQSGQDPVIVEMTAPDEDEKKPTVWRAGKLPKELPAWFKQLDTDNDGQVSLYEWRMGNRSLEEFQKIDRNGDGFVTVDEVLYYQTYVLKTTSPGQGPGNDNAVVQGGGRFGNPNMATGGTTSMGDPSQRRGPPSRGVSDTGSSPRGGTSGRGGSDPSQSRGSRGGSDKTGGGRGH